MIIIFMLLLFTVSPQAHFAPYNVNHFYYFIYLNKAISYQLYPAPLFPVKAFLKVLYTIHTFIFLFYNNFNTGYGMTDCQGCL